MVGPTSLCAKGRQYEYEVGFFVLIEHSLSCHPLVWSAGGRRHPGDSIPIQWVTVALPSFQPNSFNTPTAITGRPSPPTWGPNMIIIGCKEEASWSLDLSPLRLIIGAIEGGGGVQWSGTNNLRREKGSVLPWRGIVLVGVLPFIVLYLVVFLLVTTRRRFGSLNEWGHTQD